MRRRCKSGTEYPLMTSPRYSARIHRRSEKPFGFGPDMRKPKRVRFVDGEMDGVPVHDSSERCEADQSPRSDAPKTSEFAYFRKVKNGAIHDHSRSLRKENQQLKSSRINNLITETSGAFGTHNPSTKDFKISVSGERAGPSDHNLFLSPRVSKYDEPDHRKLTGKSEKRSSLLYEDVTPVGQSLLSSPPHEASENSENEYSEKGIFSAKRDRLHQWAAQTLFYEAEELPPKGFDFVSALMSRLFPKDNENNNNDSSKGDADNSSKSLILHQSNNHEKGIHLSHKRDWDKDIRKINSDISTEIILPELDTFVSRFPFPNYGTENRVQDLLDQHPTSRIYRSSHTQNDFSFSLPFERYRPTDSFRFKGLDDFGSITDHPIEEVHKPLLEWDFECTKDRMDSSVFNHDATMNLYAGFSPSWNVDQKRFTDKVVSTKGSCSSFSNYFLEFDSLPNTQHVFGPNIDDVKCALTEPGQFSLALPSTPKCITMGEDRNEENIPCNNKFIFSYRDQHWLKNMVWDGKPQSEFVQKYLSASDFSAEDYPSIFHAKQFPQNESSLYSLSRLNESSPLSEGAFYHNFLSSNLQSSLDASINRPLLLDCVSRDRSDREIYFDDDDNELKYI